MSPAALIAKRLDLDVPQRVLGTVFGVTSTTIGHWENERQRPPRWLDVVDWDAVRRAVEPHRLTRGTGFVSARAKRKAA